MEGSAEEHDMVTQDVRVDNENVGENVTSSDERQCAKVSNAEEKPPASSAIDDLTTGDFILDKVFMIVRKATFKGEWFNRDQYSVSVEVIDGGCGPASMFTSSTVNGLDTVINESLLLLYKRVNHNNNVTDGPKLNISVRTSSGLTNLLPKKIFSKTIPIPSPGPVQQMNVDIDNGAAVVNLHIQSQPAEERIITKERYDDFEYNQLKHMKLPLKGGEQGSCSYKRTTGHSMVLFWIPGRNDYLMHVLTDIGIDVFSIDLRRCGRAKLPDQDPLISHHSGDLTEYIEEIDMSWDLAMKVSNNSYKKIFFYGHSTESGKRLPCNLNLTKGWVNACVNEQKSLKASHANNGTPTLILTSRHDHTLNSASLLKMVDHVSTFRTEIELTYARHDVFLSPYALINEEALGYLRAFLLQASQIKIKL